MHQSLAGRNPYPSSLPAAFAFGRIRAGRDLLFLLVAGVAMSACEDVGRIGDGLADKPTPPATAREPLSPGSAGLAWAAPSSTGDEWIIGPQGIGPLIVGAPYQSGTEQSLATSGCSVESPEGAPPGVSVWLVDGRIASVLASQRGPRLLGGVGVGSSEAEMRRHFAGRLEEGTGADAGWWVEVRPETLSGHPVAFQLEDGYVRRIRVGSSAPGGACQ